jgi:predicted RNase H-like HicB family nuclease
MKKREISQFNVIFEPEKKGGYSVSVPELPGCVTQGKTFEHAQKMAKEAILVYLEELASRHMSREYRDAPIVSSISVDHAEMRV